MLRDFGFVEPYPQRFHLGDRVSFTVNEVPKEGNEGSGKEKELNVKYAEGRYPVRQNIDEFKYELQRLKDVHEDYIIPLKSMVPEHEYNIAVRYHDALSTAFTLVIERFEREQELK